MARHPSRTITTANGLRRITITCLLALLPGQAIQAMPHQQGWTTKKEAKKRDAFAQLDTVDWANWKNLAALLGDIHRQVGVPALAAAYVKDGKVVDSATIGVVRSGTKEPVAADARFHLGSVTKSFTAVLIAKLVEQGKLTWSTTVAEALPDLAMHDAYRTVTIEDLLRHRGGLHAYTHGRPKGHDAKIHYQGSATEARARFLADALQVPPIVKPGQTAHYSNAGYALAGRIAERITGSTFEQLMKELVFDPLAMKNAGCGIPERPSGHVYRNPEFVPVPKSGYPQVELVAPAGNIHCSLPDLARYTLAHLAGLSGKDGFLPADTVKHLHSVPRASDQRSVAAQPRYACGWLVERSPTGDPLHRHSGTVGASYAEIALYPRRKTGTVFLTTVNQALGEQIAGRVSKALQRRFDPIPTGFVSKGGTSTGPGQELVTGKSTPAADAQFWKVIRALSESINDEDRKAYLDLFNSSSDRANLNSMFDFMAKNVLPIRGGVSSFHRPNPPIKLPESKRWMRSVIFHLEDGYPGTFGITLDATGKIEQLSLFVKRDLCKKGPSRKCPHTTKKLDGDFR